MSKTTCPSCEAEIEFPDDPRIDELKESLDSASKEIARLHERMETKPVAPVVAPVEVKKKKLVKKTRSREVEAPFYGAATVEEEYEEEEDDDS